MSDKLIGEANYVTWANAMRLSLVSNGKITKPTYDEVKSWETVNDVIFFLDYQWNLPTNRWITYICSSLDGFGGMLPRSIS